MNPRISVIMPVFNNADYLHESIGSVLNQTFSDFEFIVINDGSTDGGAEILEDYSKADERIILINDFKNRGLIYRLNQGLKLAKGEFIARADGDDICYPERFEKQINFLELNSNVAVCGGWFEYIGSRTGTVKFPLFHDEIKVQLLENCPIAHPLVMFRRSLLYENDLEYNHKAIASEDYDLWTRIVHKTIFANLPEVMLKYRLHSNQVSEINASLQLKNSIECRMRMLEYIWDINNDENRRLASIICYPPAISSLNDTESILKILGNLSFQNNKSNFFDSTLFKDYLDRKRKEIVKYYFHNKERYNLSVLLEFLRASQDFKEELSIGDKFKLLAKCIIYWHKNYRA